MIVAVTDDEIKSALSKLGPVVAFDTETNGVRFHERHPYIITFFDGKTEVLLQAPAYTPTVLSIISSFFERTPVLIGHNIVFDVNALHNIGIDCSNSEWIDTLVMSHLLDERRVKRQGNGLKALAKEFLMQETVSYEKAIKYGRESEEFRSYAMNDAVFTWQIAMQFKTRIKEEGLDELFREIEMPFLKTLAWVERNGIHVDLHLVARQTKKLKETKLDTETKILDLLGEKYSIQQTLTQDHPTIVSNLNLGSTYQLQDLLYKRLSLPEQFDKKSKRVSTNTELLRNIQELHPVVPLIIKFKNESKLLSSFFETLPNFVDPDGRARPRFNDTGTETGRLSSSEFNCQQLPKEEKDKYGLRKCFTASEGHKIISCDYAGQEIRVLAHLSQDKTLIDTLIKGKDLHLATANQFYNLGIAEEDLYDGSEGFEVAKKKHKAKRNQAKTITFGIAYGKSAVGFAEDFKSTVDEAQEMLDKYFAGFPGVKRAIDDCAIRVKKYGFVSSLTGRRRRFEHNDRGFYSNGCFRQAFNFTIQGFSADMIRIASNKVYALARAHPEWGLKQVATVHDENVYEVKEEFAETARAAIKVTFETAVSLLVPMASDCQIGDSYGTAH